MPEDFVFSCIWWLLHFICSFAEFVWQQSTRLWRRLGRSYDLLADSDKQLQCEMAYLERCRSDMTKQPAHLCVIIGAEEPAGLAESLFPRLILYALSMDMNCISFFDARELLQEQTQSKGKRVELQVPKFVSSEKLDERRWIWSVTTQASASANGSVFWRVEDISLQKQNTIVVHSNGNGVANGNCYGNGNGYGKARCSTKSIEINILEPQHSDGRSLFSEVAREVFQQRHTAETQKLLADRNLLALHIDRQLRTRLQRLPDPEVAIVFNKCTSTFGIWPWQTRFTEYFTTPLGTLFDAQAFVDVMYRYARCEQRWGK